MTSDIERAERSASGRASVMALLAAVLAFTATFGLQDPVNDDAWRGASWLLELLLALAVLSSSGGLMLSPRLRALMDDERARDNRMRAFKTAFFVAILAGAALYAASEWTPIALRGGLRLVTGLSIAAGLARAAMLEWFS